MNAIVLITGVLVAVAGVGFAMKPSILRWWVDTFARPAWIYAGLSMRAVLGFVFIQASASAAWPSVILGLGWIMIAAAAIGLLVGTSRLTKLIGWFGDQDPGFTRAWGLFAVAFGVVIAVAA